jgi:hypothetical protein
MPYAIFTGIKACGRIRVRVAGVNKKWTGAWLGWNNVDRCAFQAVISTGNCPDFHR